MIEPKFLVHKRFLPNEYPTIYHKYVTPYVAFQLYEAGQTLSSTLNPKGEWAFKILLQ